MQLFISKLWLKFELYFSEFWVYILPLWSISHNSDFSSQNYEYLFHSSFFACFCCEIKNKKLIMTFYLKILTSFPQNCTFILQFWIYISWFWVYISQSYFFSQNWKKTSELWDINSELREKKVEWWDVKWQWPFIIFYSVVVETSFHKIPIKIDCIRVYKSCIAQECMLEH